MCGLEFSFWQEATAATGEMLDLLLLAAALWLLLEYRIRRESCWLDAAAFVWGLGMAENWLMLLTLPLFVAGVIWLQKLHFFQWRFLRRMAGLGLAGFSICVLLPLVNGLAPHSPWSFGEAWLASWQQTKSLIRLIYYQFWVAHRPLAVAVALFFLLPTMSFVVRMRDEGTRHKSGVEQFQLWIYRGLRALLLLACLWLAFDPASGLRQIIQREFSVSLPLLTLDYLNALGAAFLAGNFLLLAPGLDERRNRLPGNLPCSQLIVPFAVTGLILLSAGLLARNLPARLPVRFYPLERFGELAVASLPAGRGVMLSDQPQKLAVFQAALAHHRHRSDWLAVDTRSLPTVAYRDWLERRQPLGWLTDENRHELTPGETVRLLESIARTNLLCYLHPACGRLFERFYLEPAGAIYEMKLRNKNIPEIPALPGSVMAANEAFWAGDWQQDLARLVPVPRPPPAGWQKKIQRLGFMPAPRFQDQLLAEWYSVALDNWGVTLQQQGRWHEAQLCLMQALQLNTNNLSAQISLACNSNLLSGHKLGLAGVTQMAGQWGNFPRLNLVMNNWGPFDAPVFCYLLGCAFQQNGLPLQAVQQFERTRTLAPDVPAPEFALAELYTRLQLTDRARPLINHLRDEFKNLSASSAVDFELALLEANVWLAQTNLANTRAAFESVLQRHPNETALADRVLKAYLAFGDFTNALRLVATQLAKSPDDVPSLNNQAAILIQAGNAAAALPILDHVLSLTNLPLARLNRAIARADGRDFAAAETDYRELEKNGDYPSRVSYGLAGLAEQRHDTNQVAHYLRLCLTNTPPDTTLWHQASARLQAVEPGSPSHPRLN